MCVSFSQSQDPMKKHEKRTHPKEHEQHHEKIQRKNMTTTITTKNHGMRNHARRNHENKITEETITKRQKHETTKSRTIHRNHTHAHATEERKNNMRSTFKVFTDSCNSQCLSHFAAALIVVRAKTSTLKPSTKMENTKMVKSSGTNMYLECVQE